MAKNCPLCEPLDGDDVGFAATLTPEGFGVHVACRRCGYYTVQAVWLRAPNRELKDLLILSGETRRADEQGEALTISSSTMDAIIRTASVPRSMGAYFDRIVLEIAKRCENPGREPPSFFPAELAGAVYLRLPECMKAVVQLRDAGFVEIVQQDVRGSRFGLTIKGWERVDELTRSRPHLDRVFVAMWFATEVRPAYEAMAAVLRGCGYEGPFRVDDPEHDAKADDKDFRSKIDDRILAELRKARFVVADATGARPSVYYEAGFADGLGIPVIWTVREDELDKLPFDTRQHGHIPWKDPEDLGKQLEVKIRARGWDRKA